MVVKRESSSSHWLSLQLPAATLALTLLATPAIDQPSPAIPSQVPPTRVLPTTPEPSKDTPPEAPLTPSSTPVSPSSPEQSPANVSPDLKSPTRAAANSVTEAPQIGGQLRDVVTAIDRLAVVIERRWRPYESGVIAWVEDIKLADLPMILFTLLLVVVGFRQEGITRAQSRIQRSSLALQDRALRLQRDAEKFVEDSSRVAREAVVSQNRAYVYISKLILDHQSLTGADEDTTTHQFTAKVTLKNFGSTPAIERVVSFWWSDLGADPEPARQDPQSASVPLRVSMLGSSELIGEVSITRAPNLSDKEVDQLKAGAFKLCFIVHVEYEDIFGVPRQTSITSQVREDLAYFVAVPGDKYNIRT
jgi:hypothetical protein